MNIHNWHNRKVFRDPSIWLRFDNEEKALIRHFGKGEFFEFLIQEIYLSILNKGDLVIDGGANRGRHTFSLSHAVSNKGMVLAFEPIPILSEKLNSYIKEAGLKNIKVFKDDLSDKEDVEKFFIVKNNDGVSGLKINSLFRKANIGNLQEINVPVIRLDKIMKNFSDKNLRFIKLDLEGGEFNCLKGGQNWLKDQKPLIVFENSLEDNANLYDYSKEEWFKFFSDIEYKVFDIYGRKFLLEDWYRHNLPGYFIAASKVEDIEFITERLPLKIEMLFELLNKKSFKFSNKIIFKVIRKLFKYLSKIQYG